MSSKVGRTTVDFTDENMSGLRVPYTSFEKNIKSEQESAFSSQSQQPNKNIDRRLKATVNPTLVEYSPVTQVPPGDLITYDVAVDPDSVVCFYGRENFLSNYFTAPMTIQGCLYPTVEHYYEACKLFAFGGPQWSAQLKIIRDPGAVKSTVKRLMSLVEKWRVDAWKRTQGFAVIEHALQHKFTQHKDLAQKLMETGDFLLVHSNPYDALWASGANAESVKQWATTNKGTLLKIPRDIKPETIDSFPLIVKGRNALGYFLMQTRFLLKNKMIFIPNENKIVEEDEEEEEVGEKNDDLTSTKNVEDICLQLAKINVQNALHRQKQSTSSSSENDE